jgi:hypothetical protein
LRCPKQHLFVAHWWENYNKVDEEWEAPFKNKSKNDLRELTTQDLSTAVFVCATAGVAAPKLFDELVARQEEAATKSKNPRELTTQDLRTKAWAYATAGVPAPALFDELVAQQEEAATKSKKD